MDSTQPSYRLTACEEGLQKPTSPFSTGMAINPPHLMLQTFLCEVNVKDTDCNYQGCSWDEVLTSIDQAIDAYNEKGKKSKFRKVGRNSAIVSTLESLAQVVPEGKGLSVLRGGLSMIFKLIQKRTESTDRILHLFHEIPLRFERACGALISAPKDEILCFRVRELYHTLLQEIPRLIEILLRRHEAKFLVRLIKQHPEVESSVIDECLESVEQASNAVNARTEVIHNIVYAETNKGVEVNTRHLDRIQNTLTGTHRSMLKNTQHLEHIEKILKRVDERAADLDGRIDGRLGGISIESQREIERDALQQVWPPLLREMSRVTAACNMLSDVIENGGSSVWSPTTAGTDRMTDEGPQMPRVNMVLRQTSGGDLTRFNPKMEEDFGSDHPRAVMHRNVKLSSASSVVHDNVSTSHERRTPEKPVHFNLQNAHEMALAEETMETYDRPVYSKSVKLWAIPNAPSRCSDLKRVLSHGSNLNQEALSRSKWLVKTDRFATWIPGSHNSKMDMILVDGHCEEVAGKLSALSVVCATLTVSMIEHRVAVIYHFCGEHASWSDPMAGPRGMLRNLIAQIVLHGLLMHAEPELFHHLILEDFRNCGFRDLVSLLRELLYQILGEPTIYIILDSISEFEIDLHGWRQELEQLVEVLRRLGSDSSLRVSLRILMSCSIKSTSLVKYINQQDHISLRAGNMYD